MHRRTAQADPDRYIPTPVERIAQELAVLGGTASILQGTLDRVNVAGIRKGPDHNVGGLMFKAVSFIGRIDADGARMIAHQLFVVMDDIQLDEHPWTVRYAVPFLRDLIQRLREQQFDTLTGI